MMAKSGYEKCAHLYDLFDTKENVGFFLRYGSEAGEVLDIGAGTGRIVPLSFYPVPQGERKSRPPLTPAYGGIFDLILSPEGRGKLDCPSPVSSPRRGEENPAAIAGGVSRPMFDGSRQV
jgi:hypothetical protein